MLRSVLLSLVMCALLACGGNTRAPVDDRSSASRQGSVTTRTSSSDYTVQRGETLYSIAFRYGLDYRKVAAANRIAAPYTIYPGQRIVLEEGALSRPAAKTNTKTSTKSNTRTSSSGAAKTPTGSSTAKAKPATGAPPVASSAPVPAAAPKVNAASSAPFTGGKIGAWRWPTSGRVVRGYSSPTHKGIDIDGTRGDPIFAVAAGKVVYAGTGIVGLGELLIIKHNDIYLSAYAHNDVLLVKEGQLVSAGQQIARKGSSGTDVVKLHFEIRKAGKPVDPQRLLPRR